LERHPTNRVSGKIRQNPKARGMANLANVTLRCTCGGHKQTGNVGSRLTLNYHRRVLPVQSLGPSARMSISQITRKSNAISRASVEMDTKADRPTL
jgi:hypothetical protein